MIPVSILETSFRALQRHFPWDLNSTGVSMCCRSIFLSLLHPPFSLLFLLLFAPSDVTGKIDTDEQRLVRALLDGYDTAARPVVNASSTVQVKFAFTMVQIPSVVSVASLKYREGENTAHFLSL